MATIGSKTIDNMKSDLQSKNTLNEIFKFKTINNEKIIDNLKETKSVGYDQIQLQVIKDNKHKLMKSIVHIINTSITTGSLPDEIKIARITSIYIKVGTKMTWEIIEL